MRVTPLCQLSLSYTGDFHLVTPYGNESGEGWGVGEGVVTGERLSGSMLWSNHPSARGDGSMRPDVRGFIQTADGAEVMVEMSGRTVFDDAGGHQMLHTTFESEAPPYAWLNNVICVSEGRIDPETKRSLIDVYLCEMDG